MTENNCLAVLSKWPCVRTLFWYKCIWLFLVGAQYTCTNTYTCHCVLMSLLMQEESLWVGLWVGSWAPPLVQYLPGVVLLSYVNLSCISTVVESPLIKINIFKKVLHSTMWLMWLFLVHVAEGCFHYC